MVTQLKKVDLKILDEIINKTIKAVESSKKEIYEIADTTRAEYYRMQKELQETKKEVNKIIKEVDSFEKKEREARLHLMKVNRNFSRYSEEDIKEAYEKTQAVQKTLFQKREREVYLRKKRDELEIALRKLYKTMNKAETLVTQVSVVLEYLTSDLGDLTSQLGEIHQRQMLAFQVMKAQEEERKRVAREIHDGPAQGLASIVTRAELCERLSVNESEEATGELSGLKKTAQEIMQELRRIIFDLRPMTLDDLGIVPTLKRFIENYQEKYTIPVELVVKGEENKTPVAIDLAIFRIVQEALTNTRKHASATHATVKIEFMEKQVNLTVKDNGKGFDINQTLKNHEGEHYGLAGIQERITILEGKIDVDSAPGEGTKIKAAVPL